jgi:2-aminoethylphosphonate-pyruvate transaminase
MDRDFAPWDRTFRAIYADVLDRLRIIAGGLLGEHVVLPLQGCGTFAVEAAIRTFIPRGGTILIPKTGVYADRMTRLAREAGRTVVLLDVAPGARVDPSAVAVALAEHPEISHVCFVYSETGTGIVHDAEAICALTRATGRRVIVDAVAAFGAFPLDCGHHSEIDAMIFTPNKCLESVAGIAFVVARSDRLGECRGNAESWSFDLSDLKAHGAQVGAGHSRFTPPTQSIAALSAALDLYDAEGGREVRAARYRANLNAFLKGLKELGLKPYLGPEMQGPVVVNVHAPETPNWNLPRFVDHLREREIAICDFYHTAQPSFRVGCIGAISPPSVRLAIDAMAEALYCMNIPICREVVLRRGRSPDVIWRASP